MQLYFVVGVPSAMALLGIAVNTALYIHLSTTMNTRFAALETRMDMMLAKVIDIATRVIRIEDRFGMK